MATFTVTTAQNIDELASKAGGDTYNIDGGTLTIDQDSRYGLNQNTSAALGAITLSASLGGTVEIDARYVRLIPYNSGSGVVPVENTVISQGSASGKMIAVYSALNVAPTAVGAGMPASGYIKVKQWNSVAYAAGVLTGITATATGPDVVGWIELVGDEAKTITVNRLNLFRMRGEWYEIGTTSGNNATTYQIPSNGSAVYLGGVWVETSVAGVYDFYPCAGTQTALVTSIGTEEIRGRVCWISAAGLLRFQNDGTNSTGGYLPPANRKIRIPNIFTQNCTTGARTVNALPNATLTTRYDFTTGGGGAISIDKACIGWAQLFAQPYSVSISNTAILTQLNISELASPIVLNNVGVGQEAANQQVGLAMSLCFAGGTITDCVWTRATLGATGYYVTSFSDVAGFTFTRNRIAALGVRGHATTGMMTAARMASCSFVDCTLGGAQSSLATCTDVTFTNTTHYDTAAGLTNITYGHYVFVVSAACARMKFDGVSIGVPRCPPYGGVLSIAVAGCTDIKLRNIGTYAAPYELGGPRVDDVSWSRVTTTATVTSVAHGLRAGDTIWVVVCTNAAAITLAAKAVLAGGLTADAFTFTCVSSGTTSGTLSYYHVSGAYLLLAATGAACSNLKVQRCYALHTRTNLLSWDNSNKNVLLENVVSDFVNVPLTPPLNLAQRGVAGTYSLAAQTSCYGTHWVDYHVCAVSPNVTSQSWTRTTTTATVTSANHGLRTGMVVVVTASSSTAAIVLGLKTVTAINSSTFTFTCLSAGDASGTITYDPCNSRIALLMNEPSAETATQVALDAGTPAFTSAGAIYMPAVNDQATFTTPEFILGHTGFPIAEAVMGTGTIALYDITYCMDKNDGSGYGSWHNLYYGRTGATGTSGAYTFTVTDATGVEVGDYVWGTNVGYNAKVTDVTGNTITVDIANIGTVSGTARFAHLPSETVNAELGFKMKWRIKTITAGTTTITYLAVYTRSTDTSRAYQYPLDTVPLTLTGLKNPTEVRVFAAGTTTSIAGQEDVTTGTFTALIDAGAYPSVDISILALGYQNTRLLSQSLGTGLTIPVQQQLDRQYLNP